MKYIILLGTTLAILNLFGCGKLHASNGIHAVIIPSPDSSTCYAILDANDNPLGGNCK